MEIWKRHEAAQDRRLGRMAAGIQEAKRGDPLEGAARDRLYQTFASYYHFVLKPWNSLCDPLLARFKREIDRNHFTVCPVTRAKSQASFAKVFATQKVRVSDVLAMDIGQQRNVSAIVSTGHDYINGLRLIMNGFAVVGCFEVRGADSSLRAKRWAP